MRYGLIRVLDRYIFKEFLPPFLLALATLSFAVFAWEMLRFSKLFVGKSLALLSVDKLILYLIPSFLAFTLPAACLIASVITFSRLAYDREIVAIWGAGVSLLRLSAPTVAFSSSACVLAFALSAWGHPLTTMPFSHIAQDLAQEQLTLAPEPAVFNTPKPGIMFFTLKSNQDSPSGLLFIYDRRHLAGPVIIVARSYEISNPAKSSHVTVRLRDGTLHYLSPNLVGYHQVKFSTYGLKIDLASWLEPVPRSPSIQDIFTRLRQSDWKDIVALRQLTYHYRGHAFPAGAFILGMLGMPLGILSQRSKRASPIIGSAIGLVIFIAYYMLNIFGELLVIQMELHPFAGAWLPNGAMLATTIILFGLATRR
jgi:LPS export ABC transporter permease LptF